MTGWELRIWRKSMLWSREKAAREFGVTQRTWHAWENAVQVDVTVWRTTQALSVRDLLPHMQGMRAKWHLNRSQFGIRIDHDLASISDHSLASQSITIWHASDH